MAQSKAPATKKASTTKAYRTNKTGRPFKNINYSQVYELAKIQCTDEEIAAVLGFTRPGFSKRKGSDPALVDMLQKGKEEGRQSLRRRQWEIAQGDDRSAATMCIWLGKQWLNQQDRQTVTSREELAVAEMTDEQLLAIAREGVGLDGGVDIPDGSIDQGGNGRGVS